MLFLIYINVTNTKFLGIFLDRHLNFVCHINAVVRKLNFLLMMLRFLQKFLNDKSMVDVYYSFLYPHLIYGLEFWGHAPDYALEQVLICQKKALRIICCQPPNSSISHQFANLKIMPIYMLFKYRSLIFFHNQISNDIDLKESLKVNHDKFTRQNQSAFKLPLVKTEKGKRSMFYFSAQLYNQLAWGFIDYPTRAFEGGVAACLWEEDICTVH